VNSGHFTEKIKIADKLTAMDKLAMLIKRLQGLASILARW